MCGKRAILDRAVEKASIGRPHFSEGGQGGSRVTLVNITEVEPTTQERARMGEMEGYVFREQHEGQCG